MGNDLQDGFDLIDYPCDFAFKAMCKVHGFQQSPSKYVRALVARVLSETVILDCRSNLSRTGKFESVTVSVRLQSREELERVYKALTDSDRVVMTL